MCRIAIAQATCHRILSANFFIALPLGLSKIITTADFSDGQATSLDAIYPSPKTDLDLLGQQSSTSRVPANKLGPNSFKGTLTFKLSA
jgi:hypothetical protein